MVSKSRLWLALCASLLWISACDDSSKCGGESKCGAIGDGDGDGNGPGDGDKPGDGDGNGDGDDDPYDGGCVYCGDAGPDGSVIDLPEGSVGGFVFSNANPPVPLKDVRVVGPNNRSTMTNGDGFFLIENLAPGDGVLRTESTAHTHTLRSITVHDDASLYLELFLKPVYKTALALDKGGVAKDKDSGATVVFPADSLKRADGTDAKGKANVSVVAVNEGKAKAGTTKGTNSSGTSGSLKNYSNVEVRVEDDEGARLQISNDKEVDVEFPVGTKAANPPSQVALWSMDEKDGNWKQEGTATKTVNGEGQTVYKAKIKHMSWWAAGELVTSLTCARGCVKQGDVATAGASVEINAVSGPFASVLSTDNQGCFYVDLEPSTDFTVTASNAAGVSSVLTFTSSADLKTVADDKTACVDIGSTLQLVAPPAGAPRCPAGYELCGNKCVDIRNDANQCGTSCNTLLKCGENGAGADGAICMNGLCQCPPGFSIFNNDGRYECVDFNNDPDHCGTPTSYTYCDTYYTLQGCVNGTCTELVCPTGTQACSVYDSKRQRNVAGCVDTQSDPLHCGGCNYENQCDQSAGEDGPDPNFVCVAGQCGCAEGTTQCKPYSESEEFFCHDTKNDGDNCGGCGQVQGVPAPQHQCDYNTQQCSNGSCVEKTCPTGHTLCNGECWDLNNDWMHCSTSCSPVAECGPGYNCVAGTCTEITCGAGLLACDHQCVPDDKENCHECGNRCTNNMACTATGCECPDANTIACAVYEEPDWGALGCVDKLDSYNCGGCGTSCNSDHACVESKPGTFTCNPLNCAAGTQNCDSHECNDLTSDADNCGACYFQCTYGSCQNSACVCPASQKACPTYSGMICVDKAVPCNFVSEEQALAQ